MASHSPAPSAALAFTVVACLTAFIGACYGFGISLFAQLVPDMRAELGFGYGFVGLITAGVQLAFLAFALLSTWLAARIGGAPLALASTLLCSLALLVIGWTGNTVVLAAALLLMGGTAASVYVPMIEVVSRVVGGARRGFAMSVISSGTSYGVVLTSLIVPVYAAAGAWRSVWLLVGAATLVLVVLAALVFRAAGLLRGAATEDTAEMAGTGPSLRQALPWVMVIWALSFLNGLATFPFQYFLSSYLREELGYTVAAAGGIWSAIGIVGIAAGLTVGWLSSRLGLLMAMRLCYLSFMVAGGLLVLVPSVPMATLAGVLFAVGFYPIFGLLPAYVSQRLPAQAAVTVFGIGNVVQGLGGALGNGAAGALRGASGGFAGIYAAFALVALLSLLLTLRLTGEGSGRSSAATYTSR